MSVLKLSCNGRCGGCRWKEGGVLLVVFKSDQIDIGCRFGPSFYGGLVIGKTLVMVLVGVLCL